MAEFLVYDVPGRVDVVVTAVDLPAAKAAVESSLDRLPANRRSDWSPCGSGEILTVSSASGVPLGHYWLRSAL